MALVTVAMVKAAFQKVKDDSSAAISGGMSSDDAIALANQLLGEQLSPLFNMNDSGASSGVTEVQVPGDDPISASITLPKIFLSTKFSGVTAGVYGGSKIPSLTIDKYGRVTAVSLSDIPGPSGLAGGDLGGDYPSPSVLKVRGFAIPVLGPTAGNLRWTGSVWSIDSTTYSLSSHTHQYLPIDNPAFTTLLSGPFVKIGSVGGAPSGNVLFNAAKSGYSRIQVETTSSSGYGAAIIAKSPNGTALFGIIDGDASIPVGSWGIWGDVGVLVHGNASGTWVRTPLDVNGNITVGAPAGSNRFASIDGAAASTVGITLKSVGQIRWIIDREETNKFEIRAYDSASTYIDAPISIPNAAGSAVLFSRNINLASNVALTQQGAIRITTGGQGQFAGVSSTSDISCPFGVFRRWILSPATHGALHSVGVTPSAINFSLLIADNNSETWLNGESYTGLYVGFSPKLRAEASAIRCYTDVFVSSFSGTGNRAVFADENGKLKVGDGMNLPLSAGATVPLTGILYFGKGSSVDRQIYGTGGTGVYNFELYQSNPTAFVGNCSGGGTIILTMPSIDVSGRIRYVSNNSTGTGNVLISNVNTYGRGVTMPPGTGSSWMYDGVGWVRLCGAIAGLPS
jgi:hypothetical protein